MRTVSGWLLTHPDTLQEDHRIRLKAALVNCPELEALAGHIRAFARMLTQRDGEQIAEWITAVRADDLPSLHTFASGLERDMDAVTAGLSTPWNSGVVESHVNLKGSRCSSARCSAAPDSLSCASEYSLLNDHCPWLLACCLSQRPAIPGAEHGNVGNRPIRQ
ncbi:MULTISPECIES: transposase [Streptomyces]|uniref:transposase n=1 Tax=Streptomyces TaxID=1883 RepID=UPI0013C5355B|nr:MULTISPECIES: transposase [Streptomyces]MDX3525196.1 hypothetical protein [Streptomyces sp. ID05-39B]MDX3582125.1 hypothetical protein [Streptomyces europaeiscabiei]MDX3837443.1 hypothetical protein [Streptomyces europaeiscabiei]